MVASRSSLVARTNGSPRGYRDLDVNQRSLAALVAVHALAATLPSIERYELASQLRRASKSIPANISEGFSKRASAAEFKKYMRTAMGSANEMETHLQVASRLRYGSPEELAGLIDGYNHIGRQLNRLISNWRRY